VLSLTSLPRSDWATAGRTVVRRSDGTKTSPLLTAALAGCLESVEWFLSEIPLRHYLEFAKSKAAREDLRLKHLGQTPGGIEGAITKWLDDQSEFYCILMTIYRKVNGTNNVKRRFGHPCSRHGRPKQESHRFGIPSSAHTPSAAELEIRPADDAADGCLPARPSRCNRNLGLSWG